MPTLKVKIEEEIIIKNQDYNSKRVVSIENINEVYRRIITIPAGADTVVATFATAVSTSAGAFDVNDVKYLRITNLDRDSSSINIALIGAASNAQFLLEAGKSLMMGAVDDALLGEEDTSPAFSSLADLASISIDSGSNAVNVELFIASV